MTAAAGFVFLGLLLHPEPLIHYPLLSASDGSEIKMKKGMKLKMQLNIHNMICQSRVNGPGCRFVIWFQGCKFNCPGCFNPDTHSFEARMLMNPGSILSLILKQKDSIDGVSISGGEPLCQPEGLLDLLHEIRQKTSFSILLFSGYTYEEICKMPLGEQILSYVDVLIDGRYDKSRHSARNLLGSSNQQILILTNRYTQRDFEHIPSTEIIINSNGQITTSGIHPIIQNRLTK